MSDHDIVIRRGQVVDGTGAPGEIADVAIEGDRIAAVGEITGRGRREIDAEGLLVTPGFVDIHSHYDGQATWESRLVPSSFHGVTTVVAGNCGVGFAPAHPTRRQQLIELMEGVEDIPEAVLDEGLRWDWESFESYLDVLQRRSFDMDVAVYVPHSPVRFYVMGDRAAAGEQATAEERARMAAIVADAVEAGAIGFSTSRTVIHKSSTGAAIPTLDAPTVELLEIAAAMGATGKGVVQVISDFDDPEGEFELLRRLAEVSGRPVSFPVVQDPAHPDVYRRLLAAAAVANADGLELSAQVAPRGPGMLMGVETSLHPFVGNPVIRAVADLAPDRLREHLRRAEVREKVLAAEARRPPRSGPEPFIRWFDRMFLLGDPPDYEPDPSQSVSAIAEREGRSTEEVAYDMMTAGDGPALLYVPLRNYVGGSLDSVRDMLADPSAVIGLADGGAHVAFIADGSFPTTLLSHWGRDRRYGRLPLELLVHLQTAATAAVVGLDDRGVLAPGRRADVNVIDFERLRVLPPEMSYDLPAGGRRFTQGAVGYRHTFVRGVETYFNGAATGDLPGRLVRSRVSARRSPRTGSARSAAPRRYC